MLKFGFLFVFVFSVVAVVWAVPIESLISAERMRELRESENSRIFETQLRNPAVRLVPYNDELRQFVEETKRALNPGMMIEGLYWFQKPDTHRSEANGWDPVQKIGVFNQLTAISSLTGVQYFSASRNAMRVFYDYSVVIDGAQTRRSLPDPVFARPPEELTLFARQRDLTFGDNVYRYDFRVTPTAIFFVQENVTALSFGIIPLIGRGNLRSIVALIDCGDGILVYAVSMARAASLPGTGDRVGNSLRNRAEALLNWLSDRLNNEVF
ncbi:MAG: hypothetical protein FWC97_06005 [Treponema sp.]|nr:hypothetical protein [Treponema sp.]